MSGTAAIARVPRALPRLATLLAVLLAFAAGAPVATAQDGPSPQGADTAETTFADQFFISRKTDVRDQTRKSVEILGSLIIWFLMALSIVSIGLIGNMALTNQRKSILPGEVVTEVRKLMAAGKFREALELAGSDESYFSRILRAALKEASHGFGAVIRTLELTAEELTTIRFRRIELLNVIGQVSPMIGLFGTVYGMILAFHSIVAAGGNANPILLAGGIGTALTTTFWGLIVAIPALAGYAIIRNRIDELTTEATRAAEELLNQFRPKAKTRTSSPPEAKQAVATTPNT